MASTTETSLKRTTVVLVSLIVFALLFHIIGDRKIPSTELSRVRSYVVPITPQVSGSIKQVIIQPNQEVQPGDVLLQIDPTDYQLQLEKAQYNLQLAGQEVGAQTATIDAAQARLSEAQANLDNVRQQTNRVLALVERNLLPVAEKDQAQSQLSSAQANVRRATADLNQAKQALGKAGQENAKVQAALRALQIAQLNLERTTLRAPAHGGVSNFRLEEGFYANAGQPIMSFLSIDDIWVEAYFRENSLEHIHPGDKVEMTLDFAPGRVFKGEVVSTDYGVNWGQSEQLGQLANINPQVGWLRDVQYFPVTIKFSDDEAFGLRRVGGQADVIVYSDNSNFLFDLLGKAWIRIVSVMSYVR